MMGLIDLHIYSDAYHTCKILDNSGFFLLHLHVGVVVGELTGTPHLSLPAFYYPSPTPVQHHQHISHTSYLLSAHLHPTSINQQTPEGADNKSIDYNEKHRLYTPPLCYKGGYFCVCATKQSWASVVCLKSVNNKCSNISSGTSR